MAVQSTVPLKVDEKTLVTLALTMVKQYCPDCAFRQPGTTQCDAYDTNILRVWTTAVLMLDQPTDGCVGRMVERDKVLN